MSEKKGMLDSFFDAADALVDKITPDEKKGDDLPDLPDRHVWRATDGQWPVWHVFSDSQDGQQALCGIEPSRLQATLLRDIRVGHVNACAKCMGKIMAIINGEDM